MAHGKYTTVKFSHVAKGMLGRILRVFSGSPPNPKKEQLSAFLLELMLAHNKRVEQGSFEGFRPLHEATIKRWPKFGIANRMEPTCFWMAQFLLSEIGGLEFLPENPEVGRILDTFDVSILDLVRFDAVIKDGKQAIPNLEITAGLEKFQDFGAQKPKITTQSLFTNINVPLALDLCMWLRFQSGNDERECYTREPILFDQHGRAMLLSHQYGGISANCTLNVSGMQILFDGFGPHCNNALTIQVDGILGARPSCYRASMLGHYGGPSDPQKCGIAALMPLKKSTERTQKIMYLAEQFQSQSETEFSKNDLSYPKTRFEEDEIDILKLSEIDTLVEPGINFSWWKDQENQSTTVLPLESQ